MLRNTLFLLFLLLSHAPTMLQGQPSINRIAVSSFGTTPDGLTVERYTLRNRNGMEVKIMTYGATITDVWAPDRTGKMAKVVIGSDNLADYMQRFPAASVIGRVANRIKNAKFTLDGQIYQVTANIENRHHIHGGNKGFAKRVWRVEKYAVEEDRSGLTLSITSPDGDEGYPGNLTTSITYSLTDKNELILDYAATTDAPTVVNLTNHAYFDLSGSGDIEHHQLSLNADYYTLTDDDLMPTGAVAPVKGTPLDFNKTMEIGSRTNDIAGPRPNIYDHNYVINNGGTGLLKIAEAYYPGTGRVLEVHTTLPGVQLYTGNPVGFCLETQHFPDAVNHPHFPSTVVRPDRPYASQTVFTFSVR